MENIDFLNAILYVAENGCKWRKLPKEFGPWHTIYMKMRCWADNKVWPRVLEALKHNSLLELILRSYCWTVPVSRFIRTAWGR